MRVFSKKRSWAPAWNPAFPVNHDFWTFPGLSKREEFAKAAMQGLLAGDAFSEAVRESAEEFAQPIAEMARLCADALLAELAKEPTP